MASRPPRRPFDPNGLLARLAEFGVDYLLVGGLAARLHGSPMMTQDTDLVPDPAPANLERLAAALSGPRTYVIDPRFRKPLPRQVVTPNELGQAGIASYYTDFGRVDVLTEIPGAGEYAALEAGAKTFDMGNGITAKVADLASIITSKEVLGRPRDVAALPALYELRARLDSPEQD